MTREHVAARLLAGSSYEFERLLTTLYVRISDEPADIAIHATQLAARSLIKAVHQGNTDWHIHRGIEAMHHLDWAYRKLQQIQAGPNPKDPT